MAEAHRTVSDIFVITAALTGRRPGIETARLEKLEAILHGTDDPDEETNALARNTQFELYVAAYFTLGGAEVWLAEPDLRVLIGRERAGIAAKRLASPKRVKDRLRDGIKQIERSGGRGFVALNLDVCFDAVAAGGSQDDMLRIVAERTAAVDAALHRYHQRPGLMGVLTFATVTTWFFDHDVPHPWFDNLVLGRLLPGSAAENELFDEFFAGVQSRFDAALRPSPR